MSRATRDIPTNQEHSGVWRAILQSVADGDEDGSHAVNRLCALYIGDTCLQNAADESRTEEARSLYVN